MMRLALLEHLDDRLQDGEFALVCLYPVRASCRLPQFNLIGSIAHLVLKLGEELRRGGKRARMGYT